MEYCDEGTLEEVSRLGLQEHVIRLYSKQITTAINVLHEHGIVHRDIKGQCCMVLPIFFTFFIFSSKSAGNSEWTPMLILSLFFLYQEPTSFWHRLVWLSWVTLAARSSWGTTHTPCPGRWTAHWEQQVKACMLALGCKLAAGSAMARSVYLCPFTNVCLLSLMLCFIKKNYNMNMKHES